jgi:hypothetical protein
MARKLILPAEVKVCATCSYWDGERRVNPETRLVVVSESCSGECMVKACERSGLTDVRGEDSCVWEHLAPDEPERPEEP